MLLAAIVVIAIYGALVWAADALGTPAFKTASYITPKLRKPVKPATVLTVFRAVIWIVRWILLPVALLPMFSGIATHGWRGFPEVSWRASWRYWIAVPMLLLFGLKLPVLLLGWTPHGSFALELVSFSFRALFAYLLFVASLVALAAIAAFHSPSASLRDALRKSPPATLAPPA
jgi:hypothetical protein